MDAADDASITSHRNKSVGASTTTRTQLAEASAGEATLPTGSEGTHQEGSSRRQHHRRPTRLCQGRARSAASSAGVGGEWVNDDGDFGPRVEGISRARARADQGLVAEQARGGARQRGSHGNVQGKSLGRRGSGRGADAPRGQPRARHRKRSWGSPTARPSPRDRARRSRHGNRRRTRRPRHRSGSGAEDGSEAARGRTRSLGSRGRYPCRC